MCLSNKDTQIEYFTYHTCYRTPVFSVLVLVLIALNISLAAPTYYNDINWLPGTSQQYQT